MEIAPALDPSGRYRAPEPKLKRAARRVIVREEEAHLLRSAGKVLPTRGIQPRSADESRAHASSLKRSAKERAKLSMLAPARRLALGIHCCSGDHENCAKSPPHGVVAVGV